MASEVTKDEVTGDVVDVKLDEVIKPGDPRWGVHNPEVGPSDTLSVHDEEVDTSAIQEDIPQKEAPASDELYIVKPDEQASVKDAKASAKSDSSSKS